MVYLIIFICLIVGIILLGIANIILTRIKRKREKLDNDTQNHSEKGDNN